MNSRKKQLDAVEALALTERDSEFFIDACWNLW